MASWQNRIIGLEYHKQGDIAEHPFQWRGHTEAQIAAIRGILAEVGIAGALLAYHSPDNDGALTAIDGHLRKSLEAGVEWPVLVLDVNDAEALKLLASFDPIGAMARVDLGALQKVLTEVETEDVALQAMLEGLAKDAGIDWGGEPPEDPGAQIDRGQLLAEEYGTAIGQIWQCGEHRLAIGNCTARELIQALMEGGRAGAVVTDFPYNIGKDYGVWDDDLPEQVFWDEVVPTWLDTIVSVIQGPAHFITTFSERGLTRLVRASVAKGFHHRHTAVWHNPNRRAGSYPGQWPYAWEPIVDFTIGGWRKLNNGNAVGTSDVWIVESPITSKSAMYHPAEKPLGLWEDLVGLVTDRGELVLDPFLGSGTTLVACQRLGRRCRGVEISPQYAAISIKRWEDLTGGKAVLLTNLSDQGNCQASA